MKKVVKIFTLLTFAFILSVLSVNAESVTAVSSAHMVFVDNAEVPLRAFNEDTEKPT